MPQTRGAQTLFVVGRLSPSIGTYRRIVILQNFRKSKVKKKNEAALNVPHIK